MLNLVSSDCWMVLDMASSVKVAITFRFVFIIIKNILDNIFILQVSSRQIWKRYFLVNRSIWFIFILWIWTFVSWSSSVNHVFQHLFSSSQPQLCSWWNRELLGVWQHESSGEEERSESGVCSGRIQLHCGGERQDEEPGRGHQGQEQAAGALHHEQDHVQHYLSSEYLTLTFTYSTLQCTV